MTRECKVCGRTLDLATKFEKPPGAPDRRHICVTCREAQKRKLGA